MIDSVKEIYDFVFSFEHPDKFFYVACNSEEPERIYLSWQEFVKNEDLHQYVSVFDHNGALLKHFKNVDEIWTDKF